MTVVLLWRNLDRNWLAIVVTLAPTLVLLAVQVCAACACSGGCLA